MSTSSAAEKELGVGLLIRWLELVLQVDPSVCRSPEQEELLRQVQCDLGVAYLSSEEATEKEKERGMLLLSTSQRAKAVQCVKHKGGVETQVWKIKACADSCDCRSSSKEEVPDRIRTTLEKCAKAGITEAEYRLGKMLLHQEGEQVAQAMDWLKRAASKGHGKAAAELGNWHYLRKEPKETLHWHYQGALKYESDSLLYMGSVLLKRKRYRASFRLFERAARSGNPAAQYSLALAYGSGKGVEVNPREHGKWMRKAADARFQPALVWLAKISLLANRRSEAILMLEECRRTNYEPALEVICSILFGQEEPPPPPVRSKNAKKKQKKKLAKRLQSEKLTNAQRPVTIREIWRDLKLPTTCKHKKEEKEQENAANVVKVGHDNEQGEIE